MVRRKLGAERARTSYAWRTLKEAGGALLAGGSDAPVSFDFIVVQQIPDIRSSQSLVLNFLCPICYWLLGKLLRYRVKFPPVNR